MGSKKYIPYLYQHKVPAMGLTIWVILLLCSGSPRASMVESDSSTASPPIWQWAVDTGIKTTGKAFLWIPTNCTRVKGLIVGQQVILEKLVFEDPIIRTMAAKNDLAIVFIVPAAIGYDDFGPEGKGASIFQSILDQLALASGYGEIAKAPFFTLGHSGGALFAWRAGYWKPERCLGIIGLHAAPIPPPAHNPKATIDGVPILDITGQYESWGTPDQSIEHHWRWVRADLLALRAKWPRALVSELVQPGKGHFNWDKELAQAVAKFMEKAAQRRLPKNLGAIDEFPDLQQIPLDSGWLTDCTLMTPSRYAPARYREFTGDPSLAFWHLDEEMASCIENFGQRDKGKKLQLLSFIDNEKPLAPAWIQAVQFSPLADGRSLQLKAEFVKTLPPEFKSLGETEPLGHAIGDIQYRLIGGWSGGGLQTGPDTFRLQFDRFGLTKGSGSLMVMAYHPGDATYAPTEQPCDIKFPPKNKRGPQTIQFEQIADVDTTVSELTLSANSRAGDSVEFVVISGPAWVQGSKLYFQPAPPRSRWPIRVNLAAVAWGRGGDPAVASAEPVFQSFLIHELPQSSTQGHP